VTRNESIELGDTLSFCLRQPPLRNKLTDLLHLLLRAHIEDEPAVELRVLDLLSEDVLPALLGHHLRLVVHHFELSALRVAPPLLLDKTCLLVSVVCVEAGDTNSGAIADDSMRAFVRRFRIG
jgi:hypothetical protein